MAHPEWVAFKAKKKHEKLDVEYVKHGGEQQYKDHNRHMYHVTALNKSKKDLKYHKYFLMREATKKVEKERAKKQEEDKQQAARNVAVRGGVKAASGRQNKNPRPGPKAYKIPKLSDRKVSAESKTQEESTEQEVES